MINLETTSSHLPSFTGPVLTLFQNPLEEGLRFTSRERQQTTLTWYARIPA